MVASHFYALDSLARSIRNRKYFSNFVASANPSGVDIATPCRKLGLFYLRARNIFFISGCEREVSRKFLRLLFPQFAHAPGLNRLTSSQPWRRRRNLELQNGRGDGGRVGVARARVRIIIRKKSLSRVRYFLVRRN